MRGLRIQDLTDGGYLAFDLREVLAAIGSHVKHSEWQCEVGECVGRAAHDPMEFRFNVARRLTGDELGVLAGHAHQVMDGVFRAFAPGARSPWLVVEAVDGSWWEVRTNDGAVLDSLRATFRDVVPLEDSAPPPRPDLASAPGRRRSRASSVSRSG